MHSCIKLLKRLKSRRSSSNVFKNSAFTLVEIIIVVMLMAILGTIALSMFFGTSRSITFFANFTNIQSTVRQARSMAVNMMATGGSTPDRYGIYFEKTEKAYEYYLFADNGAIPFLKDNADIIIEGKHFSLSQDNYELEVFSRDNTTLFGPSNGANVFGTDHPVSIFFEKDSAEFNLFYNKSSYLKAQQHLPRLSSNYVAIKLYDPNEDIVRYLVINQVSGLSEEMETL